MILASYTWSEDAQRWGSLSPDDRIEQALEDVAQIHPQILKEFEVGASWMWHDDEFAGGAFALFDPGQQTLLHEQIIAPGGTDPLCRRARLAVPRLDPGRDRIRAAGGDCHPRARREQPVMRSRRGAESVCVLPTAREKKTPQVPCTARF